MNNEWEVLHVKSGFLLTISLELKWPSFHLWTNSAWALADFYNLRFIMQTKSCLLLSIMYYCVTVFFVEMSWYKEPKSQQGSSGGSDLSPDGLRTSTVLRAATSCRHQLPSHADLRPTSLRCNDTLTRRPLKWGLHSHKHKLHLLAFKIAQELTLCHQSSGHMLAHLKGYKVCNDWTIYIETMSKESRGIVMDLFISTGM